MLKTEKSWSGHLKAGFPKLVGTSGFNLSVPKLPMYKPE